MSISERVELLGKGLYTDIPDELTLKGISNAYDLDYVGAEDFDKVLLETILPHSVVEKIDFYQLLEIDYQWLCRCLRFLNFGPYHTTNAIFCPDCGAHSYGEYQVNLTTIQCIPLPEGFVNNIVIPRTDFIKFNGEVTLKLPTIRQIINAYKDPAFQNRKGKINKELARICYMISTIGGKSQLTPIEIKLIIESEFCAADYVLLKELVSQMTDYGLRSGGTAQCPKCASRDAAFIALSDDRFFRPTIRDLREWKNSGCAGANKDVC